MEFPTLFQKTATGSINYWQVWTNGPHVCTRWGQVGTASPQEQVYKAEAKNIGRANATTPEKQAELEAKSMWEKKKRLKYFGSQEEAAGKLNMKPLLAQEYNKRRAKVRFPVDVQPKLDGYRCLAFRQGQLRLMSRGGKDYVMGHIYGELEKRLPEGLILDGELYIHGVTLQNIGSLIKRPRPESVAVQYHIYDCTYGNEEPWAARRVLLGQVHQQFMHSEHIRVVDTFEAEDHDRVKQLHDIFVGDNYEGAIIRTMDHPYRFGYRSPGLLKLKDFEDKEFPIVDWTTDKDGTLMWLVRQEDGLQFPVRPMGTEEYRASLLANAGQFIGRELTVRFRGRTDNNIPREARGLVREEWDK
jgi:ATP-dependent DNA ligase